MPSTALQSRISAFESIAANGPSLSSLPRKSQISSPLSPPPTPRQSISTSPSPSPPSLCRRTSFIDLNDWIVDDGPFPPRTNGFKPHNIVKSENDIIYAQTQPEPGAKTQLVAPLINLESPPKSRPKVSPILSPKVPPLPPRKSPVDSPRSTASTSSAHNGIPISTYSSHRSDSLTVDHTHTYPPLKAIHNPGFKNTPGHAPASSISSFHSVSLSSDTDVSTSSSASNYIATFPMDQDERKFSGTSNNGSETDSISLGESYEEVSASLIASPVTEHAISLDWEKATTKRKLLPPKLPHRPSPILPPSPNAPTTITALKIPKRPSLSTPRSSVLQLSASSPTISNPVTGRRPPPPPPTSRSSDRSSIQSSNSHSSHGHNGNSTQVLDHTHPKINRPTPVPAAARMRYETVFNLNVLQKRRSEEQKIKEKAVSPNSIGTKRRQAAGWRGLSIDLITGGHDTSASMSSSDERNNDMVENTEELEGHLIKTIWCRSKLDRRKLADIWNDCDPNGTGSLNRDGFVMGMWRIDEELRRAHVRVFKSANTTNLASFRGRGVFKSSVQRPKPIPQ